MKAIYGIPRNKDHEVEHSKISYSMQTELNKASNNGSPYRNLQYMMGYCYHVAERFLAIFKFYLLNG